MGAQVLISSTSLHRIAHARAWLEARAPAEEVLIIGANLDAANDLARGVARERGAAFGWHRLTWAQFAAALAAPALAELRTAPLSGPGVEAIASRAVHRVRGQRALGRYAPIAETPGFVRAIAGAVTEMRLARLAPDGLAHVGPDLQAIFQAYETELAEGNLTDWPGILSLAAKAITDDGFVHRLVGLPTLLLDVPIASEVEFAIVSALCDAAPSVLVTIPTADERTLARFKDRFRLDIEDLDQLASSRANRRDGGSGSLRRLQHDLFREESDQGDLPPDDEVLVFSGPGESRECIEIARRVLALAREGIAFDRIAVLLRAPVEYRAHLEEAFARARVPAHFARGAVRPDPVGRAFYALLRCASEGISARRFAEYLSLSQVPDAIGPGTPPEAAPRQDRWVGPDQELFPRPFAESVSEPVGPVPPSDAPETDERGPLIAGHLRAPRRWERFLVEAAVIGGQDRWRKRIAGLANEKRLSLDELGEEDEARATSVARTLEDLEAFAGYALPLIDALAGLPASASWGEWLDHLSALATRALRQPDRVLSVLSELAPMASVGPIGLSEVLLVLSDHLLEVAVPPPAQRYGSVFVGPAEAARGLSFEAVFVPGLAEKLFPRKIVEEPLLLDAVRKRLGGGLATNEDRLAGERLALALAVGAAERRLYLSYPRLDLDQGRPRVPSFYALETVRAAEGRLPDFAELGRRAETVTSARVGWPAPRDPSEAI